MMREGLRGTMLRHVIICHDKISAVANAGRGGCQSTVAAVAIFRRSYGSFAREAGTDDNQLLPITTTIGRIITNSC
jgi:hypothetical protein